jgi:hypothetical protein
VPDDLRLHEQVGRCEWCGGGVWPSEDPDYVRVRGYVWHRRCAEALHAGLGDAL